MCRVACTGGRATGAAALVSNLRWNMGLSSLSMQYCEIGAGGARAIGERLLGSAQVRQLTHARPPARLH